MAHTSVAAFAAAALGAVPAPARKRGSARERLLAAADELFYEGGINLVGIDRVIERAGVAKASLYDCFGSKEELIRAYLEGRSAARRARILERIERYADPKDKILSVFDLLSELAAQSNYRGCAFLRASGDAERGSRVRQACDASRAWLRSEFTELAAAAGSSDATALAGQLMLLYDGASVGTQADADANAPSTARALVVQLLSALPP